jgi:TATA-binding protein-associated factor Taf7
MKQKERYKDGIMPPNDNYRKKGFRLKKQGREIKWVNG